MSATGGHGDFRDLGDYVIETAAHLTADQKAALMAACDVLAIGDDVHDVPAGIYLGTEWALIGQARVTVP